MLAIVAAIAIPVVTNVVASTNTNAAAQTQSDIQDFVNKYNESGAYSYDATEGKFVGYIDLNGNGSVDSGEAIDELDVDTDKFSITASATDAPADAASVDFDVTPTASFTVALDSGTEQVAQSTRSWSYNGINAANNNRIMTIDGVQGDFFDEGNSPYGGWSGSAYVLSLYIPQPGDVSAGGYYYWDEQNTQPGSLYGSWNYGSANYENNILFVYNESDQLMSVHMYFTQDPLVASTVTPASNPEWSASY